MAHSPRKKKRVHVSKAPPFPVPIASITTEPAQADRWFYYTGVYHGTGVTVHHSGDLSFLYTMGFFGKGNLSRSKPEYNNIYKTVWLKQDGDSEQLKVVSRRKYKCHLKWLILKSGDDLGSDYESDNDTDDSPAESESKIIIKRTSDEGESENIPLYIQLGSDKCTSVRDALEKTGCESNAVKHPTECVKSDLKSAEEQWEQSAGDEDFWATEKSDAASSCNIESFPASQNHLSVSVSRLSTTSASSQLQEPNLNVCHHTNGVHKTGMKCDNDVIFKNEQIYEDSSDVNPCSDTSIHITDCPHSSPEIGLTVQTPSHLSNSELNHISSFCHTSEAVGKTEEFHNVHPLCTENDSQGDVFVLNNSDEETSERKQKRWVPVIKSEPFHVEETLQLSLEEAFFLSYGLGCLNVLSNSNEPMTLSHMWKEFSKQTFFLPKYIAYHYYRSKGWVPKSGLKFGTDYIVYKEGPAFYHGSFSVVVRMINSETMMEVPNNHWSWRSLSGLNRMTEHVAKALLICFVIVPSDLAADDLLSPSCISKFKVQEVEINRWISTEEREENRTKEDIP